MPAKRELTMRQIRQLLRLDHDGVSAREIGRRLGVARSTIQDYLHRAKAVGLAWPLPTDLTDERLEQRLFTDDVKNLSRKARGGGGPWSG